MFGPAKGADLNLKLRPIFQSGLIKTIKLSKPIPQALAHHARRFEVIRRALRVALEVLDTPRPPLAVTADKAYDSEKVRQQIKDQGALPVIPSRSTATKKAYCPKRFYRRRHKIENYFCRIKDWRRIATRYDKLARNFLAAATLVGALYWIKL